MSKQKIDAPRGVTTFNCDAAQQLIIIGYDTEDGPDHELWTPDCKTPADEALAKNIIENGVLEPVLVRQNGTVIEVVAGRGRTKAVRLANQMLADQGADREIKVPCMHRPGDAKALVGVIVSENEHRKTASALDKARNAERLMKWGYSIEEAANACNVTPQTIRNRLTMLECTPAVRDAMLAGEIPATSATKLATLTKDEQLEALEELRASGNVTSNETARVVRNKKRKKPGKKGKKSAKTDGENPRPGVRLMRKIVDGQLELAADERAIDESALNAIRWVLGDVQARSIKGLSTLVASIEAGD